jgi:hypothetical protein
MEGSGSCDLFDYRLPDPRPPQRSTDFIAVARHLIVIAYHLIRDPVVYRDLGENYFDTLHAERTKLRLVKRLEHLGHQVTLSRKQP